MDVYRALNADVPQLLCTVLHQTNPTVAAEDYAHTATALHMEIRWQAQAIGEELHQWLEQQYNRQAEETARKLQRLAILSQNANLEQVQEVLVRDYRRLGNRIGTESVLGMQGSGEEVFDEETPTDPDLAKHVSAGREYLVSLGFKPGHGVMHESWLLFRGSLHYDVMQHVVRDRMGIYKGTLGDHLKYIEHSSFGTYDLIYQLGEDLTADLAHDTGTQEVTFAFSKSLMQYSPFRQEVSGMMEHIAEQVQLQHASFWQRKLGLGTGKEFVLRLRLPIGEAPLKEIINIIAGSARVGKETIVKRGKLLLGKRVL
jgi:hypothetical protein